MYSGEGFLFFVRFLVSGEGFLFPVRFPGFLFSGEGKVGFAQSGANRSLTMDNENLDLTGTLAGALQNRNQEEDAPPFSLLAGAPGRGSKTEKVSLEEAGNLLTLRQAQERILQNAIPIPEFVQIVTHVRKQVSELLDLYDVDEVNKELEKTDSAQRKVAEDTYNCLDQIEKGIERMLAYAQSHDPNDLKSGLEQVEAGYESLDRVQDEAIRIVEDAEEEDDEDD